jgi:hypothetical protein
VTIGRRWGICSRFCTLAGVIAVPTVSATPVDEELRRYGEYMERVRGLAPKTRSIALRIIARLLTARFGEGLVVGWAIGLAGIAVAVYGILR